MSEQTVSIDATGWARADRSLRAARGRLTDATTAEECQDIGLLCRETLISAAQAAYDPARHTPLDGTIPSSTDAGRMLEAIIARELASSSHEEARRYAKSVVALAVALQHRRTANRRDAELCLQATTSVVNLLELLGCRATDPIGATHRAPTDAEEREAMAVLIGLAATRTSALDDLGLRRVSMTFGDTFVSVSAAAGESELTARIERPRWWHPASSAAAAALLDEVVVRMIAQMPPLTSLPVSRPAEHRL